jgi:transposase
MRYIGIDLHTNSFTACYLEQGKQEVLRSYELQGKGLDVFIDGLQNDDEIALEITGNSVFFRDKVIDKVKRVVIISTTQFKVIRASVKKTDKNDARAIAFFLSKDMLSEAKPKSPLQQQLSSIAQSRDQLVKTKVALINKVYGILNTHGVKLKKTQLSSKKGLQKALDDYSCKLSDLEIRTMKIIQNQIFSLLENIKEFEILMIEYSKKLPGYKNILSIKGIGNISAAIILSSIEDISNFKSTGKLAAYLGIVPRVSQSNDVCINGRITKKGSKLVRTTLVQCSLIAIRYSKYLCDFYNKIKSQKGSAKAIIATARKLLNTIFYTLKKDWIFEDFSNFKLFSCI